MNFNEYQELSGRTANDHFDPQLEACNWAMGLAGEVGEYIEIMKKAVFHGKKPEHSSLLKELGDILWYVAQCASYHGFTLEEIAIANIEKLKLRYPEGFRIGGGIRND